MTRIAIKRWQSVHRWSSLVSTAFLLMLCATGLPLIFHEEIERSMQPSLATPVSSPPSIDALVAAALTAHPGSTMRQLYFLPDRRLLEIETGAAGTTEGAAARHRLVDVQTGGVVPEAVTSPVLDVIHQLHIDMFAGLAGSLFLGTMGLLMIVAIVSGVVLYGPFTRKLPFGTVRPARRARWLDLHNLVGIVTVAWLSVVGLTGAVNTLSGPVARYWQQNDLAAMAAPFMGGRAPTRLAPVADVIATAERAAPGMWVTGVYYPGSPYATPRHYGVYLRGDTPVTARLLTPMLIDGATGKLDAIGEMPLYVSVLLLSQPLHFGDYGGLPLKIIWAALDIAAVLVLVTGLYLFVRRGAKDGPSMTKTTRMVLRQPLSRSRKWRAPVLIGMASIVGIIMALLAPAGPARWLAWLLVLAPAVGYHPSRRRPGSARKADAVGG